MEHTKWIGLGYSLPANPSKNRVYVWRKLKDFGALLFKQSVAVLPNNRDSLTCFLGLAARIRELGGEASIIEIKFLDPADEREMVRRFLEQSESEYLELLRDCANILDELGRNVFGEDPGDELRKMVRRYNKAKSRDYFKSARGADTEKRLGMLKERVKGAKGGNGPNRK